MEKDKLNRIIGWIREEMMTVGNTGYQSGGDQTRAGFDPVMGKGKVEKRKKKYLSLGPGSRKRWMKKDES